MPKSINLFKLSDEQIIDIIKSEPFEILNPDYHIKIVRISDGNPRLAIMTSLLAKQEQDLDALHNVSHLFEKYFSTFIKDDGKFENPLNIKCLGLIAFFYTIPFENKEVTESILHKFDISYYDFIDTIVVLEKLELVEVQFEHVKIPEQNLAVFFFYKVFIKDDLLSFNILLNNYFENYKNRFADNIIPANNTFGPQNVMVKIKPDLVNYWKLINSESNKAFDFLNSFWFYLQDQTLEFVYQQIRVFPKVEATKYDTSYERNQFSYNKDEVIELLGKFFHLNIDSLKDAIILLFEYVSRKPDKLPELIHKIREILIFDRDDERYDFYRQKTLFNILIAGVKNNDELLSTTFYELSKTFLSHRFQQTKGRRNDTFVSYQYPIPNSKTIQEFRANIWDTLDSNFEFCPIMAFSLLKSYSMAHLGVNNDIMEFDIPFILEIIDKHLINDSFEHCKYVQSQIRWFKRNKFDLPEFSNLTDRFVNDTYLFYLKIDWDRIRDKEILEFDNSQDYDRLKETEIRKTFILTNESEVNKFYEIFILLKDSTKNDWYYNTALDIIIDENFSINPDIGLDLLNIIVEKENENNYIPRNIFINQLKTENKVKQIWEFIQTKDFYLKELWEISFYYHMEDSLINKKFALSLVKTITKMKNSTVISFGRFERFLVVEPNLFQIILKIITKKNDIEDIRLQVSEDLFDKYFKKLGDNLELIKKAYIQQNLISPNFDYEGEVLKEILKIDKNFLIQFVESLYTANDNNSFESNYNDMSYIWDIKDIEESLIDVLNIMIEKAPYFGLEHNSNVFFRHLKKERKKRANNFIKQYVIDNNSDYNKMQIVVDILNRSKKDLFEEVFLLFLSLNQDKEMFSRLMWRGRGVTYSGNVIISDIEASEWRSLLEITNKSDVGVGLIPIKTYINEQIESCLERGDWERQRKFLKQNY